MRLVTVLAFAAVASGLAINKVYIHTEQESQPAPKIAADHADSSASGLKEARRLVGQAERILRTAVRSGFPTETLKANVGHMKTDLHMMESTSNAGVVHDLLQALKLRNQEVLKVQSQYNLDRHDLEKSTPAVPEEMDEDLPATKPQLVSLDLEKVATSPAVERHFDALKNDVIKFKSAYTPEERKALVKDIFSMAVALKDDVDEDENGLPAAVKGTGHREEAAKGGRDAEEEDGDDGKESGADSAANDEADKAEKIEKDDAEDGDSPLQMVTHAKDNTLEEEDVDKAEAEPETEPKAKAALKENDAMLEEDDGKRKNDDKADEAVESREEGKGLEEDGRKDKQPVDDTVLEDAKDEDEDERRHIETVYFDPSTSTISEGEIDMDERDLAGLKPSTDKRPIHHNLEEQPDAVDDDPLSDMRLSAGRDEFEKELAGDEGDEQRDVAGEKQAAAEGELEEDERVADSSIDDDKGGDDASAAMDLEMSGIPTVDKILSHPASPFLASLVQHIRASKLSPETKVTLFNHAAHVSQDIKKMESARNPAVRADLADAVDTRLKMITDAL